LEHLTPLAIRVVLADESDLLLAGAQTVIHEGHRLQVVAVVRSLDALLESLTVSAPDVVVMSESLHHDEVLSVLERVLWLCKHITTAAPRTPRP